MASWPQRLTASAVVAVVAASCSEPASLDTVVLVGRGASHQVRQGGGPITLQVSGANLGWVVSASLEDLSVTWHAGPGDGGTLDAVVAHGVAPGPRQLSLMMADGRPTLTAPAAVEVTTIRAAPAGNDALGSGTTDSPYRTATHSLSLADTGDQIDLSDGTYDVPAGEQWGTSANVPNGIVMKGAASGQVTLDGAGAAGTPAALVFAGGGQVSGFTARNFDRGLVVSSGVVVATDVVVRNCQADGVRVTAAAVLHLNSSEVFDAGTGVVAINSAQVFVTDTNLHNNQIALEVHDGAHATVATSFLERSTQVGLYATHTSIATIDTTAIDQNGTGAAVDSAGVYMEDSARVTIRGSGIRNNKGPGLYALGGVISVAGGPVSLNGMGGLRLNGATQVALDQLQVNQNTGDGINVSTAGYTVLDLTNSTLQQNTASGLVVAGGASTLRANTFTGNVSHAVRVLNNGALALEYDPAVDAKVNELSVPNFALACVSDERTPGASSTVSIDKDSTLQGSAFVPGLVGPGPIDVRPFYTVSSGNNLIFAQ